MPPRHRSSTPTWNPCIPKATTRDASGVVVDRDLDQGSAALVSVFGVTADGGAAELQEVDRLPAHLGAGPEKIPCAAGADYQEP